MLLPIARAELEWVKVLEVNSKLGMVIMLKFCLHW
jgi:hypothetical protein